MKKTLILAVGLLLLAACSKTENSVATSGDSTRDSLRIALANQDSLLVLMSEIQDGIFRIKAMENMLSTGNLGSETSNTRQQIRNDMEAIQEIIAQKRRRIDELEARLNKEHANNANLQRAIETLRAQIADQEATIESLREDLARANIHIKSLTSQVSEMNTQVDSLNTAISYTNAERQKVERQNEDLTKELYTCYIAVGNKKTLKESGLIETGFLRKTKVMPDNVNKAAFMTADKRYLDNLPLNSKKCKLLTSHPASSYQIVDAGDGTKDLLITDPDTFWSTSNFLIIQID